MGTQLLFKVTKISKSWRGWTRRRVRYGGPQVAVQTWNYAQHELEKDRPVIKVELVEVTTLGEVDMEKYVNRNKLTTFLK